MFSVIYKYWTNLNDTPSILFKINVWTYVNIRFFKFKFSRNVLYFIQGLNGLKINNIMYLYKDWIFEDFYFKFFKYFVVVVTILLFI
jgi:hypothetical protein